MKNLIRWLKSIRIHRVQYDDVDCFVVADWGGWIPGSARTRLGAFLIAFRAQYGKD